MTYKDQLRTALIARNLRAIEDLVSRMRRRGFTYSDCLRFAEESLPGQMTGELWEEVMAAIDEGADYRLPYFQP